MTRCWCSSATRSSRTTSSCKPAKILGAKRIARSWTQRGRHCKKWTSTGLSRSANRTMLSAKHILKKASKGIDVVIDYLWGRPTELLLEALAKSFKASATHSTRLVEVGESAGKTINLPGATLRSIDLKILGSGFGSVSLEGVLAAIPNLFAMAAKGIFKVDVEPVPLADVESAWSRIEKGRRIVFTI